jgi:hypothetical protein
MPLTWSRLSESISLGQLAALTQVKTRHAKILLPARVGVAELGADTDKIRRRRVILCAILCGGPIGAAFCVQTKWNWTGVAPSTLIDCCGSIAWGLFRAPERH